jgi:hypothetical protein
MQLLFRNFSHPGGNGSHATPEVPGSLHEVSQRARRCLELDETDPENDDVDDREENLDTRSLTPSERSLIDRI